MGFAMSYSRDIKNFLCEIPLKRLCCKRALLYGMLSTRSDFANREIDFDTDNGKTCLVFSRAFKSVYSYVPLFDTSGFAPDNITGYKMKALPADITERVLSEADSVGYRFDEFFSCDSCRSCFFRGAFLAGGTISDPLKKGYHLEMLFKSEKMREAIKTVFDICKKYDKSCGIFCDDEELAKKYRSWGANVLWMATDRDYFLRGMNAFLDGVKDL